MRELTVNEQLFRRLMHLQRRMRMSMPEPRHPEGPMNENRPPEGPENCQRPPMHRRPPLAREHLLLTISSREGIHQKELAEMMHVNPSSMSEFINILEDEGYIVRNADPEDKRATLITLTEKGSARAAEIRDEREERFSRLFGSLSEEEKIQLNDLLGKIIGNKEQPASQAPQAQRRNSRMICDTAIRRHTSPFCFSAIEKELPDARWSGSS